MEGIEESITPRLPHVYKARPTVGMCEIIACVSKELRGKARDPKTSFKVRNSSCPGVKNGQELCCKISELHRRSLSLLANLPTFDRSKDICASE